MPSPGDVIVEVDRRYFRPTEVETLLGDPSRAKEKLGWTPRISFEEMVREMVQTDVNIAARDRVCLDSGFTVFEYND
jgi:GDPmannose 4,6-dehydratase